MITRKRPRFAKTRGVAWPGRFFKRNSVVTVVPACCIGSRVRMIVCGLSATIFSAVEYSFPPLDPSRINQPRIFPSFFRYFGRLAAYVQRSYSMLYQRGYDQPHLRLFLLLWLSVCFPAITLFSRCVVCPPVPFTTVCRASRQIRNAC